MWGVLVSCRRLREDRVLVLYGLVRRGGDPARLPAASTARRVASCCVASCRLASTARRLALPLRVGERVVLPRLVSPRVGESESWGRLPACCLRPHCFSPPGAWGEGGVGIWEKSRERVVARGGGVVVVLARFWVFCQFAFCISAGRWGCIFGGARRFGAEGSLCRLPGWEESVLWGVSRGRCIFVSIVLILLVFWRFFAFLGETYG